MTFAELTSYVPGTRLPYIVVVNGYKSYQYLVLLKVQTALRHNVAMTTHSALLALLGLSLLCQYASAQPLLTAKNSDGACHCNFSLALNIPPCVCSGVVEVVEENKRLKEEIKGLVEASCFGEGQSKHVGSCMCVCCVQMADGSSYVDVAWLIVSA